MRFHETWKGIFFITLSAVCFGSYGVWSRLMGGSFGEFTQAWTRGVLLLSVLVPFALWHQKLKPIQTPDWKWFAMICLAGGLNQAPYYFAFHTLGIGTATLLFYGALTIGGYAIGALLLGETLSYLKWIALILAMSGMVCIFHFSLLPGQFSSAFLAIVAGVMGATEVSLSKKISAHYSTTQLLISIFTVMTIGNLMISFFLREPFPQLGLSLPWIAQLGYTLAMMLAGAFVFIGYQYTEASTGSLLGLSEVLFAVLFGVVLFGEQFTHSMLIGGGCIIASAALPYLNHSIIKKTSITLNKLSEKEE